MRNKSTLEFWMEDIDETLEEAKKKKKKPYDSYISGMFDPELEAKMFNKMHNTDGYVNGTIKPGQLDAAGHAVSSADEGVGEAAGGEGGCCEGLTEDTTYVSRHEGAYNFPDEVKLLPQDKVEDFILDLDVKEEFRIGYITPLELYTELSPYFQLFKATEATGYTGIDYRDDSLDKTVEQEADSIAKAKQQIANQDKLTKDENGDLYGSQLDVNQNFSTYYRFGGANKLGINHNKPNKANFDDNTGTKQQIELNRILFYLDSNKSKANIKNRYFVKLLDKETNQWTDWLDCDRQTMEDTLFKKLVDHAAYREVNLTDKDLKLLKKWNLTPEEFEAKYPGMTPSDYVYCTAKGFDPMDWIKEHPMSKRWGLTELKKKIHSQLFADEMRTTAAAELGKQTGLGRVSGQTEGKHDVRAFYTNQVYYLNGRPGTFGKIVTESLADNQKETLVESSIIFNTVTSKDGELVAEYRWDKGNTYKAGVYRRGANDLYQTEEEKIYNSKEKAKAAYLNYCKKYNLSSDTAETATLTEAKRYVRRYYIRPQEIFCSNKTDIIKALIDIGDENCSVYTLNNLGDVKDVTKLTNDDIIYYYDDGILYDKNHVRIMDYDLYVKHEEKRDKFNPDQVSDATFKDHYEDRITDITDPSAVDESLVEEFNLSFDTVNAYGEVLQEGKKETHTCCICGEEFEGYGNNPSPVKEKGVCCDSCNMHFVIPARLEAEHEEKNEELEK